MKKREHESRENSVKWNANCSLHCMMIVCRIIIADVSAMSAGYQILCTGRFAFKFTLFNGVRINYLNDEEINS